MSVETSKPADLLLRIQDWNALLYEISKLYAVIDEEWADATVADMEEFDPWDALRQLAKREADNTEIVTMIKEDKVIDRQWGGEPLRVCVAVLLNALFWRNEGKVGAEKRAEAAESKLSQLQLPNEEKARQIADLIDSTVNGCYYVSGVPLTREGFVKRVVAILNGGQS